ncbi:hypothetical protein CCACVL1_15588 [Corchorus capsularis]|uniref:F-box domain-containing protein n=1 Tax=Corchorus capsularis TaxID=210143 RepID=A0A1R3I1Y5_COCAP|nr:hypothetical protein CCACVL1_15588 [Corchorus capsularis]
MCSLGKLGSDSFIPDPNCCLWSKLCDDLVVEILCRLPPKNLITSKCVCKSWNRLITDVCVPNFSKTASLGGFFFRVGKRLAYRDRCILHFVSYDGKCLSANTTVVESISALLPFKFNFKNLMHSCNGLLLFVDFAPGSVPQYYVCNPLTKQCIEIPRNIECERLASESDCGEQVQIFAALAFDPWKSCHYKVVSFNNWRNYCLKKTVNFDVFSSDTGEWVSHTMPLDAPIYEYELGWIRNVVYLNGVVYQISGEKYLLQFDINKLNARATELPKRDAIDTFGLIGVSGNHLHYSSRVDSTLFVWFLGDHSRWVLKHSLSMDYIYDNRPFLAQCTPRDTFLRAWAFDPNSEAIYFGYVRAILRYQVESRVLEVVHTIEFDKNAPSSNYVMIPYFPCVVILKGIPNSLQSRPTNHQLKDV